MRKKGSRYTPPKSRRRADPEPKASDLIDWELRRALRDRTKGEFGSAWVKTAPVLRMPT